LDGDDDGDDDVKRRANLLACQVSATMSVEEADLDPTARYRAGNGALFSATKCPPSADLASQCELPFGVIWTPFASPDCASNSPTIHTLNEALPPVLCLTCLCYLNLYAEVREETRTWVCGLCGAQNVLPTDDLFARVVSPTVEYRQQLVDAPPPPDPSCADSTLVVVMDGNLPRAEAQAVGKALQIYLTGLETKLRIGLIVFDRSVTIYQLGVTGMAIGDVFTKHQALEERYVRTRSYLSNAPDDLQSFMRCLSAAYGIVLDDESSLTQLEAENRPLSRLEVLKKQKEARLLKQQQKRQQQSVPESLAKSPFEELNDLPRPAFRCTGEAIQVAIDLATLGCDPTRTSRILLFTNGCPNHGDGSCVALSQQRIDSFQSERHRPMKRADIVDPLYLQRAADFFGILGKAASEVGVGVDIFCCGALELALPAHNALVEASSGYVLSSLSFTEVQFPSNLQHLLQQNFVAGLHGVPLRDENWLDGCIVDVRMPR